jgi:hypothetical protein
MIKYMMSSKHNLGITDEEVMVLCSALSINTSVSFLSFNSVCLFNFYIIDQSDELI